MALTHRPGPARATSVLGNEYPTDLLPPLPDELKKRYPELAEWERVAAENYMKLLDVLLRRDKETNSSIEAVKAMIP